MLHLLGMLPGMMLHNAAFLLMGLPLRPKMQPKHPWVIISTHIFLMQDVATYGS
jgi:hypothetical protein